MKKIGFIGVGNMATQIINGLRDSKLDIKMYGENHGHINEHVKDFLDRNVLTMLNSVNDLVRECDYIIFSAPANLVIQLAASIDKHLITANKVFISIAAAITLDQYEKVLTDKVKCIRVMPNVNASVKESMTAICKNKNVSDDELRFTVNLFNEVGKTIVIKENQFDIFMSIAGSFPAIIFMLIDALNKISESYGIDKEISTDIVVQTISGSVKYAQEQNKDMSELVSTVASPNGTTVKGVKLLEKENFNSLIKKTIEAMMKTK